MASHTPGELDLCHHTAVQPPPLFAFRRQWPNLQAFQQAWTSLQAPQPPRTRPGPTAGHGAGPRTPLPGTAAVQGAQGQVAGAAESSDAEVTRSALKALLARLLQCWGELAPAAISQEVERGAVEGLGLIAECTNITLGLLEPLSRAGVDLADMVLDDAQSTGAGARSRGPAGSTPGKGSGAAGQGGRGRGDKETAGRGARLLGAAVTGALARHFPMRRPVVVGEKAVVARLGSLNLTVAQALGRVLPSGASVAEVVQGCNTPQVDSAEKAPAWVSTLVDYLCHVLSTGDTVPAHQDDIAGTAPGEATEKPEDAGRAPDVGRVLSQAASAAGGNALSGVMQAVRRALPRVDQERRGTLLEAVFAVYCRARPASAARLQCLELYCSLVAQPEGMYVTGAQKRDTGRPG